MTEKGTLRFIFWADTLLHYGRVKRWFWRNIYGKRCCSASEAQNVIYNALTHNKPCMVARWGSVESAATLQYLYRTHNLEKLINREKLPEKFKTLCFNAGFFPDKMDLLWKFGELITERSKDVDILAVWFMEGEYFGVRHSSSSAKLVELGALDPLIIPAESNIVPWTKALEGKKVLVVHPFEKSIRSQYKKRELLFENKNTLPEFELKTFKAIQTIANTPPPSKFHTWFDALSWMEDEIAKIDFDIAIIGAGAYGMPLAAAVKRMGKKAVHMGGATQILFGISGERWLQRPDFKNIMNEHWVRPLEEEKPAFAKKVEDACYW